MKTKMADNRISCEVLNDTRPEVYQSQPGTSKKFARLALPVLDTILTDGVISHTYLISENIYEQIMKEMLVPMPPLITPFEEETN